MDIQRFFSSLSQSSHLSYDLGTDRDASDDLRAFAPSQFDSVALLWHLDTPWPKESDFKGVILQYGCLYWLNHLYFPPANRGQCVLALRRFFEGLLYPLFWIEVLSIIRMVPIGVLSLRKLLSWVRVSLAASFHSKVISTGPRMRIQLSVKDFRIFVIS